MRLDKDDEWTRYREFKDMNPIKNQKSYVLTLSVKIQTPLTMIDPSKMHFLIRKKDKKRGLSPPKKVSAPQQH